MASRELDLERRERLVETGVFTVTASAGFEDFLNAPFGKALYTTVGYPGLDR